MSETVTPILQYNASGWNQLEPAIACEADVALSVNGEIWLNFACTPSDLEALAVGFLFNEGVIQSIAEVVNLKVCTDRTHIDTWLSHAAHKPEQWRRTSGCTGGATQARNAPLPPVEARDEFRLSPESVLLNMKQLFEGQALYHASRGIHCAALSDGQVIQLITEDIGRHNTLDKLAGLLLQKPLTPPPAGAAHHRARQLGDAAESCPDACPGGGFTHVADGTFGTVGAASRNHPDRLRQARAIHYLYAPAAGGRCTRNKKKPSAIG